VIQIEKFARTQAASTGEFLDHHAGFSPVCGVLPR